MSEVCWVFWDHVLVGVRLHVDYFNVFFLFQVQCEWACIGDVGNTVVHYAIDCEYTIIAIV